MTLYNEMCKNNDQKKYGITSDITILDDELLFTP